MTIKRTLVFPTLIIGLFLQISCSRPLAKSASRPESTVILAAKDVIKRVIGERAETIHFRLIPADEGKDTYEVEAGNGRLTISGSSSVAMTYGFNTYLQKACHSMVTWSGQHVA